MYTIFTDGSTKILNKKGADNIGGFGYLVCKDNVIIDAYSEEVYNTTNNRMELQALIEVMKKYGVASDSWEIPDVYTDSQYALMCFTKWGLFWKRNGWKRPGNKVIENLDLVKEGVSLMYEQDKYINILKCSGHSGIKGNELADKLATGSIDPKKILNTTI